MYSDSFAKGLRDLFIVIVVIAMLIGGVAVWAAPHVWAWLKPLLLGALS